MNNIKLGKEEKMRSLRELKNNDSSALLLRSSLSVRDFMGYGSEDLNSMPTYFMVYPRKKRRGSVPINVYHSVCLPLQSCSLEILYGRERDENGKIKKYYASNLLDLIKLKFPEAYENEMSKRKSKRPQKNIRTNMFQFLTNLQGRNLISVEEAFQKLYFMTEEQKSNVLNFWHD